jgi:hypothetical protein
MTPTLYVPRMPLSARKEMIIRKCKTMAGIDVEDQSAVMIAKSAKTLSPAELHRAIRAASWRQDIVNNKTAILSAINTNIRQINLGYSGGQQSVPSVASSVESYGEFNDALCVASPGYDDVLLSIEAHIARQTSLTKNCGLLFWGPEGSGKKALARQISETTGLRLDIRPYGTFVDGLTNSFDVGKLADFLYEVQQEKSIAMITDAGQFLQMTNCGENSAFLLLRQHKGLFIISANTPLPVASFIDQKRDAPTPPPSKPASKLESELTSAVQVMMKEMSSGMKGMLSGFGLDDSGAQGSPVALREFARVVRFGSLKPAQVKSAFNFFFGVEAPERALQLSGLVPYDFVSLKTRLPFIGIDSKDPEKIFQALCDTRGVIMPRSEDSSDSKQDVEIPTLPENVLPFRRNPRTPMPP